MVLMTLDLITSYNRAIGLFRFIGWRLDEELWKLRVAVKD